MDILFKVLEQHGLGVVLAVATGAVCWFLLRSLISNHKEDRTTWKSTLDAQQILINNHINHLTDSHKDMVILIRQHDNNSKRNSDDIVKAIEGQTSVLKTMFNSGR